MVLTVTAPIDETGELAPPPMMPNAWPADKVERRRIEGLIPYARNARTHSDEQIAQIAASIREWGWTAPVLVDEEGVLIAGHGRILAAQRLGLPEAPTIVASGWTDAQKRAYRLADNKLALNAGWDATTLQSELSDLRLGAFDLAPIGFSDLEIASILAPESDPASEWQGMPEFDQADRAAFQSIVVHCKDQAAVNAFAQTIGQRITEKTRFVWFPQAVEERYVDKRYTTDEP